jgi:hypothetical protein
MKFPDERLQTKAVLVTSINVSVDKKLARPHRDGSTDFQIICKMPSEIGLTTILYTVMAVHHMMLYGCGPYCNQAVLKKFRVMTVW